MALNFARAMCRRSILSQMRITPFSVNVLKHVRPITIRVKPYFPQSEMETYKEKAARLQMPTSPHVSIYKFPFGALLSITNRITGTMLAFYLAAFSLGALLLPNDFDYYITYIDSLGLNAPVLYGIKGTLAFPFIYHTLNGVRHLMWDFRANLSNKGVKKSGIILLVLTFLLTGVAAVVK